MPGRLARASRIARKWALLAVCNIGLTIALFLAFDLIVSNSSLRYWIITDQFRVPDPRLHHTLERNVSSALAVWGDRLYRFDTNSLGLRDARVRTIATGREQPPRVLFLGDSFTEGVGLSWDDTIVARFAAHYPNLDVLNAGVLGYSPSNYLRKAELLLDEGVRIDYAIVYIDISDIQDEALIHFDRSGDIVDGDIVVNPEARVGDPPETVWHRRMPGVLSSSSLDRFLSSGFRVTEYLRRRIGPLIAGNPRQYPLHRLIRSMWTVPGADVEGGYGELGVAGAIDKATGVMDQLASLLRARGVACYVAVYPWPDQIEYDGVDSLQVRIWRVWCARNHCAGFIDHFPDFFARKELGDWHTLYLRGDVHFSKAGAELAAERLISDTSRDFGGADQ